MTAYDDALAEIDAADTPSAHDAAVTAVGDADPTAGMQGAGASWGPVDVAELVAQIQAGTITRTVPDVLTRDDGAGLLYRGKVNGIHGDSGSGKSWAALHAASQVIRTEPVVFVDFEDSPADVIGRLLALGAAPEDVAARFRYVQPEEPFGAGADQFLSMVPDAALVVIDSTGESLTVEGADPNSDPDVAAWFASVPKRIARTGPAVLVIDHMPKASASDLWPIGSHRKRAAIDGAQYLLEALTPFSRDKAGAARLVCAKDRHGTYARAQRVGILHVTPDDGAVHITLQAPEAAVGGSGAFLPTGYMERVSRALESAPEALSFNGITERVEGKRVHVRAAVDALAASGHIATEPGPRNSTLHRLVTAYRETTSSPGNQSHPATESKTTDDRFRFLEGEPGTSHFNDSGNRSGTSGNQSREEVA